ncbi:NAD(P)/FAD-dependent oxidoreductase [Nocardioides sp. SYSU D00038]|uniref:dihydrolipoyl dehydrogenase family protein n=1 Tax=Nocardioides sp. SYSU D00038 TaxID=2812554 RepID=UPI001967B397|nr:NAD(P)/FAD-dependent oxidoreductase [Nocardioides sp. SYSU D00038]
MADSPSEQVFDVVVIGGGPAGENVADRAVAGGLSAAVVEQELVGGECSYWACMPTKALLRSAAALRAARALPGASEAVADRVDVAAVLARRDRFASDWKDDGQVAWLDGAGIGLVRGRARLAGPRRVEVLPAGSDQPSVVLTARHAVVVATGTSALVPPIPGLAEVAPWTSREAASATEVPPRLAIVGGGVVAAEMATAFSAFGSAVTLLARDGVLPTAEPFASELVVESLETSGVTVRLGAEVVGASRDGADVVLDLAGDAGQVRADQVLVAVGRVPNTRGLGLDTLGAAGLRDGGWLPVDETLRVTDGAGGEVVDGGWLYAVGDVNGRALVTHQGKYQARALGDAIVVRARGGQVDDEPWGWHAATADTRAVPQVVFTDPEVASVGLTAAAAEAAGHPVRVVDHDLGAVAGAALHADGYRGRARMVVDTEREVVLGATLVGPDVAELIHAATVAVAGEVPIKRLWHAVPAYPTISEVWLRLLEAYGRPHAGDPAAGDRSA